MPVDGASIVISIRLGERNCALPEGESSPMKNKCCLAVRYVVYDDDQVMPFGFPQGENPRTFEGCHLSLAFDVCHSAGSITSYRYPIFWALTEYGF